MVSKEQNMAVYGMYHPIIDPHPWLKGHFSRVWFFISLRRNPPQVGVTSGQKLCIEIIYIELQASVSSQKKNNTKCRKQNSKTTWKYCRSYCWNEIDDEILPVFAQFLQSLKLIYFLEFTSLNVQDWTQVLSSYMAGLFDIFILRQIWQNCVCFGDFLPMRKLWCLS